MILRFKFFYRFKYFIIVSAFFALTNYWGRRIIYNPSISETRGYYLVIKRNHYERNSIVQICIDDPKYQEVLRKLKLPFHNRQCRGGMDYLLKNIVGVAGDHVNINNQGVFINGVLQNNSNAINSFKGIDLYPTTKRRFILRRNEFFVLGTTTHSYDSRYFGVIQESQIVAEAYLIYGINHRI